MKSHWRQGGNLNVQKMTIDYFIRIQIVLVLFFQIVKGRGKILEGPNHFAYSIKKNFLKCFIISYLCISFFSGLSPNSKPRPNLPLKSQVLLMSSVTSLFQLDLATHHALNTLCPFSLLELHSSISSQSVGLLPKVPPVQSDFSLLWELGRVMIMFSIPLLLFLVCYLGWPVR